MILGTLYLSQFFPDYLCPQTDVQGKLVAINAFALFTATSFRSRQAITFFTSVFNQSSSTHKKGGPLARAAPYHVFRGHFPLHFS